MLTMETSPRAFEWGTSYELELLRDGRWIISAVFDSRGEALEEARRFDRSGEMVRLCVDEFDALGNSRGMRTVFASAPIKKCWKAERVRIAQLGRRNAAATVQSDDGVRMEREEPAINPYALLAIFTTVAFGGLGAILALRALYDAI
jgi:hypothetical protein